MVVLTILHHTPIYVFALLGYLVWQGVQALNPRTQPLWRITIAPLLFALASLALIVGRASGVTSLAVWCLALVVVVPFGNETGSRIAAIDPVGGRVSISGSPVPILRNLALFAVQYGIAVVSVLQIAPPDALAIARLVVSGASLGYCVGWLAALHSSYLAAPRLDSSALPVSLAETRPASRPHRAGSTSIGCESSPSDC